MRLLVLVAVLALAAPVLQAQSQAPVPLVAPAGPATRTFGDWDEPVFQEFVVPGVSASEPTIGIPWTTDSVFFYPTSDATDLQGTVQHGMRTYRARFDATGVPTWTDVTPPTEAPLNLDPMLVADPDTGRVFSGGLAGPCSTMVYSDDDGANWLPSINMCSGSNFDHQSIGLGPPAGPIPSPEGSHVAYYCAQGGTISCARSLDQGTVWGPFQDVPGSCGGFHGHIQVSPSSGLAVVPTASCGQHAGYITTADGGLTWRSNEVPLSEEWKRGFDPSAQFTRPGGWMYYAMASENGVHVALTKDEGKTWDPLGAGMGVQPTSWLDLGQFHDPPIASGVFTNVQAGDDDRVAVSFFGLEAPPGADLAFLKSKDIYQCQKRQEELVYRLYLAQSFDAGQTWDVQRVSDDPVQIGGIWDGGGGDPCRNLLDFDDMDIDSHGRIHIGIADGCTGECSETLKVNTTGYRDAAPRLFRQVGGRGLFKAFDGADTRPDLDKDGIPDAKDDDLDGDGIPNAQDRDVDGDGLDDSVDQDVDGDGIVDSQDPDVTVPGFVKPAPQQESPGFALVAVVAALGIALLARRR